MKKIGIVINNYKVAKFKQELAAAGFVDYEVIYFKDNLTTIKINVPVDQFEKSKDQVVKICALTELHFKRSN